jgi:hypothetical protein
MGNSKNRPLSPQPIYPHFKVNVAHLYGGFPTKDLYTIGYRFPQTVYYFSLKDIFLYLKIYQYKALLQPSVDFSYEPRY